MNVIRAIEKNKRTFSMISIQFLVFFRRFHGNFQVDHPVLLEIGSMFVDEKKEVCGIVWEPNLTL